MPVVEPRLLPTRQQRLPEAQNVKLLRYPPIELETRPAVETGQAAHYLGRRPQTLRAWACLETGPIRPVRVHGRLLWPMRDIRQLLGLEPCQ